MEVDEDKPSSKKKHRKMFERNDNVFYDDDYGEEDEYDDEMDED